MESPTKGFTPAFLNKDLSTGKRYELIDNGRKDIKLRLRVSATGRKQFIWRYITKDRKSRLYTIGDYPDISLADARDKAEKYRDLHRAGKLLPAKEYEKVKQERLASEASAEHERLLAEAAEKQESIDTEALQNISLETEIEIFYDKILKSRRRPEAPRQLIDAEILGKRKGFEGIILGDIPLKKVTTHDVQKLIYNTIERGKKEHAMKIMALLKQFFTWCENGGRVSHSPIHGLSRDYFKIKKTTQEHIFDIEEDGEPVKGFPEIVSFFETLDESRLSIQIKNGLKILLMTGVRTGELQKAKVGSVKIKVDKTNWFIPADDTKTEESWTVPLSPFVLKLFEELEEKSDKECGLYLNCTDVKAMARAVSRLRKEHSWPRFTPHTLRKVFRTHVEYLGVNSKTAEKCLNHSLGKIEGTYNKSKMLEKRREALLKWSDAIELALNPKQDNIV